MINPLGSSGLLTLGLGNQGGAVAGAAERMSVGPQSHFGSVLKFMIRDAVETVQAGETTAIAGMQGKVPLQQVVETVVQAEQTLHTAVAIRDKVVSAYLDISHIQV